MTWLEDEAEAEGVGEGEYVEEEGWKPCYYRYGGIILLLRKWNL